MSCKEKASLSVGDNELGVVDGWNITPGKWERRERRT
jgi:hypothetical protein